MRTNFILLLLCCALGTVTSYSNSIQCKDENGKNVDWYVLYKLPKISESSNPLIRDGVSYLYMTNSTVGDGWKLSKRSVESVQSMPGQTLALLYKDNVAKKSAWIMYNDQPPNKSVSIKYGHTKGVVMANEDQGFWLVHSVPNYPPQPDTGVEKKCKSSTTDDCSFDSNAFLHGEYSYPSSGKNNGQSFLCISIGGAQMRGIAEQLIYNQIISYRYNVPRELPQYSFLVNAAQRPRIKGPPYFRKEVLRTVGGSQFISFAKADKWQKDLYDDLVAPQLQTDMLAETWRNGRGKLPSECNGTKVYNVQSVVLGAANVEFKSSRDHSKWAVAVDSKKNKNWVCIGDINRADTQFNRGGGTVCLNSPDLWRSYRNSVNDIEPCPRKRGFIQRIKDSFEHLFYKSEN
ncbi:plancitoxin-1 [Diachasma alloeum]|uniref:plancitoxin-1 n=1 Tax=Diachasma alloeum TaxID=454923 RepID=UPI000738114C|nr:plancitoxin-1 [Diachasma alloeum]